MYEPGTILTLKEPRSTDEEPFPYDRVRVIGVSPINHAAGAAAEWEGASGQGIIVQPETDFAATLDEPIGKLQSLYDVEFVPDNTIVAEPVKVVTPGTAGPSPEEVFAQLEKDNPPPPTRRDERRAIRTGEEPSPLDELVAEKPSTPDSPLDKPKPGRKRAR